MLVLVCAFNVFDLGLSDSLISVLSSILSSNVWDMSVLLLI